MTESRPDPPAAGEWLPRGGNPSGEAAASPVASWLPVGAPAGAASSTPITPAVPAAVLGASAPADPTPDPRSPVGETPARSRRRPRVSVPTWVAAAATLVALGSVVALATSPGATRTVTAPPAASPSTSVAAGSPSALHGLQSPFVVGGSRFAVFVNPRRAWTTAARGRAAGHHFVFVEVLARRLTGGPTDLQALRYRLVTAQGTVTYPSSAIGTGAQSLGQPQHRSHNTLVVSRLAFPASAPLAALQLEFEPTNSGGETVAVPLSG